jgi:hypothetical protein
MQYSDRLAISARQREDVSVGIYETLRSVIRFDRSETDRVEPRLRRAAGDDRDAAHALPGDGVNSRCSSVRPRSTHVGA